MTFEKHKAQNTPQHTQYFFTRHGQSQANVDEVFAGAAETPLTEKGQAGAASEAQRLLRLAVQYDLIISSTLSRARDTATIMANILGYPPLKIIYSELLVERDFGKLVGRPWSLIENEMSEAIVEAGGESIDALSQRVIEGVHKIIELSEGKSQVLIVGHGTWYQMAETLLQGRDRTAFVEANNLPNNMVVAIPIREILS